VIALRVPELYHDIMSDDLLVRNLGADVKQRLRERASLHGRSLVAEAREILTAASAEAAERNPLAGSKGESE
jgi:plasmid stability protein